VGGGGGGVEVAIYMGSKKENILVNYPL